MNMRRNRMIILVMLMIFLTACGAETGAPETQTAEETAVYRVSVLTKAGEPVAGALVQLCSDICVPGMTDEKGIAEFELPADDYKVSILSVPEGYTSEGEEAFSFENGSREVTILLQKAE